MTRENAILTFTNQLFYPLDPREEEIHIEDIAHALSQMCRANGHFRTFYSVAQHSINCAKEAKARGLSARMQLACLLHDASEAYISDITRPVKCCLDEYRKIENHLQQVIFASFGIEELTNDEIGQIQEIDDALLQYEFKQLHYRTPCECAAWPITVPDTSEQRMSVVEAEFLQLARHINR